VTLQAWRQHPELYEKIAYGIYEFGHNLTKTSVRCEHFLPHAVAVEINYNISTYAHFLEHFKGWRQLLQELLGPDYGRLLQEFLTEMYDQQFGERNGVPYLKALVEAWRCEFYRYSIRQDSFQIMGQAEVYDPKSMALNDWPNILRFQYADFKSSLTVMKEMEFTQNKLLSKVVEAKPLGHKPKSSYPQSRKSFVSKEMWERIRRRRLKHQHQLKRRKQARNEKRQHGTSPSTSASETCSIIMVQVNRYPVRHHADMSTTRT
jgi:hypothetical protein